ncbi:MAG TPA: serine/threonine-protein kinase [Polyangiaceae bacterium]|jgi:serine/threonine protein kinase|nr:serine/threonine-protein kinase [Polyangiaceae bacterium]
MFPSDSPPHTLQGFDVLERLGVGATGEVFLARSRGGKLVAVKTIAGVQGDDSRSTDTLVREASVCARLHHPCIVQVRAFLEQPGLAALVYEYVPGVALARVLRLCEAQGVRLPDAGAWHIVYCVLTALACAHSLRDERGLPTPIVHRDLSPSNVLLDWEGGAKIADFGMAKMVGVSPVTRLGLVKGTLGCMAPEQARGETVDQRADVYAAGLLAWRLATGRVPFAKHQRDEFELLRAMRNPHIYPLGVIRPDLPAELLDAISLALESDPQRRTISAELLAVVVRDKVDIRAGARELRTLLGRWKPALERAIKRGAGGTDTESSGRKLEHTLRYEEAALWVDDESPLDGPTFEAHALPSESELRTASKASLSEEGEPADTVPRLPPIPLPPAALSAAPPAKSLSPATEVAPPTKEEREGVVWGPVFVALALAAVALFAVLLTALLR